MRKNVGHVLHLNKCKNLSFYLSGNQMSVSCTW